MAKNYRPVALTSHLTKVFEKVVRNCLVSFLEKHNLFNSNQHGFRAGYSCLSQLLQHFDTVTKLLEEGQNVDVVYLDFSKAFDKIDHIIMLVKLAELGITGRLLQWIKQFLTNREQWVYLDVPQSRIEPVMSGVPQGSVLGPLLFLIMLSDIDKDVHSSFVSSFADDTRVLSGIGNNADVLRLQEDLDAIYRWSEANNAKFNSEKFECLRYGPNENIKSDTSYKSSCQDIITSKPSVRDLGVTMSADATFGEHISNITQSASLKCGWILRTFRTRDSLPMMALWKSLVLPILDYCSQLWCPSAAGVVQRIEKVQVSYLKKVAGLSGIDYWDQLSKLKLFSLQRRRERYRVIYIWKTLEGLVPNFGVQTAHNKRTGRHCVVPLIRPSATCRIRNLRYNSMGVHGPRLFNSLPISLRNKTNCTVDAFKSSLDRFLETIPDQPRVPGLIRYCVRSGNSLTDYE